MKFSLKLVTVFSLLMLLPLSSHAHRAWILPGATVLSSDDPWVTFDAAISNDIFHADYFPMRVDSVQVLSPAGNNAELQNVHTGKYRTNFDLNLTERGTYRVFTASQGLRARWETEAGEHRGWPGRGESYSEEGFAKNVPANAKNLQVTEFSRRMETFVTAGAPTEEVLKPSGKGLELVALTHPNDLFSGEAAQFQFVINGEPAVGATVEIIPGGMRYRNSQDALELVTDAAGKITVKWP
ncbi:MAG TPA: DUF4198 domain-containing protein, partial [Cellvibrionaceae bacterium]